MLHRGVLEECCACASTCSLQRQPPAMSHCTAKAAACCCGASVHEGCVPVPADPGFLNVQPRFGAAFANMYLYNRSQAAAQLGKPWILEEVGAVRLAQGFQASDPVPEAVHEPCAVNPWPASGGT